MQFWASVAGIVFVVATLWFTKRAADAAAVGANAAAKAANAAEKALADLERPWLHYWETHLHRTDAEDVKAGKSPTPNAYFVTPSFKNAGRMVAIIQSVEFAFVRADKAPENPDYSNMSPLAHPVFVHADEQTSTDQDKDAVGAVGPPKGEKGDLVYFGRIKYRGLTTKDHVTGFAIQIWGIAPRCTSFGGEAYNYHR